MITNLTSIKDASDKRIYLSLLPQGEVYIIFLDLRAFPTFP